MRKSDVRAWITAYERAWRTPGTRMLGDLFAPKASYLQGPYRTPVVGLPAIRRMWEAEREGPDEEFQMTSDLVAVDRDTAVARVEVVYGRRPTDQHFRDLWIMKFDADGRCRSFEEWPIAPGS